MANGTETKAPPSAARLSSISTSLLTWILELSQQNTQELAVNPTTKSKILKNLLCLREGLIQNGLQEHDPILIGLRDQYARIVALVRGIPAIQADIDGQDLALPSPEAHQPLIDVDEGHTASTAHHDQSSPNTQHHSRSDLLQTSIDIPSRPRSRRALEEDEEIMRSENEQVQRIQQVLLDGKSLHHKP